ncbi:MAG: hypothetical protein ACXWYD_18950, partial [Candidatus Binatia bacterium]
INMAVGVDDQNVIEVVHGSSSPSFSTPRDLTQRKSQGQPELAGTVRRGVVIQLGFYDLSS